MIGAAWWFVANRIGVRGGAVIALALAAGVLWLRLDAVADARDRARAEADMLKAHVAEQAAALDAYAKASEAAEARARAAEARVAGERRRARETAASGAPTASADAARIAAGLLNSLGGEP